MTNFADDDTPYTIEERIDTLLMGLWKHTSILNRWFKDNFWKISLGIGHFLLRNHPKEVSIILENEIINNSNSVKLLGVTIDKKLDFNEHVTELCKKANQKLHALARISNYMDKDKLKIDSKILHQISIWILSPGMDVSQ